MFYGGPILSPLTPLLINSTDPGLPTVSSLVGDISVQTGEPPISTPAGSIVLQMSVGEEDHDPPAVKDVTPPTPPPAPPSVDTLPYCSTYLC
jgi:hypothetical protein